MTTRAGRLTAIGRKAEGMFMSMGLADSRESMPQGESAYAKSRFESGPGPV